MPEQVPVLIVGAGPSGLTMAATLHHHGIQCRLIEKRAKQTQTSNAAAIHSLTMEMLDDLGVIRPFLKRGERVEFLSLNRGAKNIAKILTAQIESHYNYMLSIPQNISEEILNHHLEKMNKPVERNLTLSAIQQTQQGIIADVIDENQKTQQIHCQYLIASDGAHSTVRDLLAMTFSGIDIKQQFVLADANIPSDYPDNGFSIYFHKDGPLAVFPFKKGKARIVATIINPGRDPKQPVSLLEIQIIAEKRSEDQLKVVGANWLSSFWIHSKMLNRFRKGNVFFIGDAAHIHSPAGGQGMNTGMQDAYNLAWKLALSIQGHTKPNLLDSYEEERLPNARALLTNTERMTSLILMRNPFLQWLRQKVLKFSMKEKHLQHAIIMEMSMLNLHYAKSPIINYEFHVCSKSPLPGQRAPDAYYLDRNGTKRMDDLLRSTKHTLLLFTGTHPNQQSIDQIHAIKKWATDRSHLMNAVVIVHHNAIEHFPDTEPLDKNNDLHTAYHVDQASFFMVRPDNYIGCCSAKLNLELLSNYWLHIFND